MTYAIENSTTPKTFGNLLTIEVPFDFIGGTNHFMLNGQEITMRVIPELLDSRKGNRSTFAFKLFDQDRARETDQLSPEDIQWMNNFIPSDWKGKSMKEDEAQKDSGLIRAIEIVIPFLTFPLGYLAEDRPSLKNWKGDPLYSNSIVPLQGNNRLNLIKSAMAYNEEAWLHVDSLDLTPEQKQAEFIENYYIEIRPFSISPLSETQSSDLSYVLWVQNSVNNAVKTQKTMSDVEQFCEYYQSLIDANKKRPKSERQTKEDILTMAVRPYGITVKRGYQYLVTSRESFPLWLKNLIDNGTFSSFDAGLSLFEKYQSLLKLAKNPKVEAKFPDGDLPTLITFYRDVFNVASKQANVIVSKKDQNKETVHNVEDGSEGNTSEKVVKEPTRVAIVTSNVESVFDAWKKKYNLVIVEEKPSTEGTEQTESGSGESGSSESATGKTKVEKYQETDDQGNLKPLPVVVADASGLMFAVTNSLQEISDLFTPAKGEGDDAVYLLEREEFAKLINKFADFDRLLKDLIEKKTVNALKLEQAEENQDPAEQLQDQDTGNPEINF